MTLPIKSFSPSDIKLLLNNLLDYKDKEYDLIIDTILKHPLKKRSLLLLSIFTSIIRTITILRVGNNGLGYNDSQIRQINQMSSYRLISYSLNEKLLKIY